MSPQANRLARETSPYLRAASHQPVDWYPWGEEAFARARELDRPVLLDIGASWCHWCHVMDRESYENPEIARIINERFVPVKVDRDERPDVDARYQAAVVALSGQGGWPLTVFLTPEGMAFFGGTYFPPEDRHGRPGFPRVLREVSLHYRNHRDELAVAARQLHETLRTADSRVAPEALDVAQVERAAATVLQAYDPLHGGFGGAPKFPHPGAVELLLVHHFWSGDPEALSAAVRTLKKMALGGVHDQLGGGFHRYSTDARWVVPHFEKLLYDNAELLKVYLHAYQLTGEPLFRETAEGIVRYTLEVLSDREQGGFYASQDADVGLHDDGDYYTWTYDEAQAVLDPEAFKVLSFHFDINLQGEMHHDPSRNVLFVDLEPEAVAEKLHKPLDEVLHLIAQGKAQLLEARRKRPAPFVDRTLYVNWNGLMISAFLQAACILDRKDCLEHALKSLDRLLRDAYAAGEGFVHRISADGTPSERPRDLLDDQVQMGPPLLLAYEITGESRYLEAARDLAALLEREYWDPQGGGFYDLSRRSQGPGALAFRHKPVQDAPTPSSNATAAWFLDRLALLAGPSAGAASGFRERAQATLAAFAGICRELGGLFAAAYYLALDHHLRPPAHAVVVGDPRHEATRALYLAACRTYRPWTWVQRLSPGGDTGALPAALRGMLARGQAAPTAYVCVGETCAPPVTDPGALAETLRTFGKPRPPG